MLFIGYFEVIGIIRRKALIKDLAAVYHAECLTYCQQLLELQRKFEEVSEIIMHVYYFTFHKWKCKTPLLHVVFFFPAEILSSEQSWSFFCWLCVFYVKCCQYLSWYICFYTQYLINFIFTWQRFRKYENYNSTLGDCQSLVSKSR